MYWEKLGNIFNPLINLSKEFSYGAVPFIGEINGSLVKIYYNVRNKKNQSFLGWSIFDFSGGYKIIDSFREAELAPGSIGTFDEDGVMGCQCIGINGKRFIYYQGWNLGNTVPFRNAIGVAVYNEKNKGFEKFSKGPILDRSIYDVCFVASPNVFQISSKLYLMYYLSCDNWDNINNKMVHRYNIKIAASSDGITWLRKGKIAVDYASKHEYAFSTPRVLREDGVYKMWYSFRGGENVPTYRIGYAESKDGYDWVRKDAEVGIDVSVNGWDSEMICYPYVFKHKKNTYMIYNGNDYGKTGFGLAVLKK